MWSSTPGREEARVFRPDGSLTIAASKTTLDSDGVLPGFAWLLAEVFA